jgi:putative hemin transport protein
MLTTTAPTTDLRARYAALRAEQPHLRIRNAAQALGVSELELLVLDMPASVVRLRPDFPGILTQVSSLGNVMALTRNDDIVHERHGVYLNPSLDKGPVGLFVGADIDLRIFWQHWGHAFAVREAGHGGERHSLQFFAHDGSAIHKIYLTEHSDQAAYDALVQQFHSDDQDATVSVQADPPRKPEMPDSAVDVAAFQQEWLDLQDTHDFYMLLGRHRLSRTQALRLAPEGHAIRVDNKALRITLTEAARTGQPIMVFAGNPGMLQIHTGPVINVQDARGWFNVLDPHFNLHVREEGFAESWVVRKPTRDGIVTALEVYNARGEQLVQLFGARKPGIPEREDWRSLMTNVQHAQMA